MAKQKAKFFCENCGAEVPADAKFCKNCGRFFTSVRCPQCGTSGPSSLFENGCPNCGYALPPNKKNSHKSDTLYNVLSKGNMHKKKYTYHRPSNDNSLPRWIYILTITALMAVCCLIVFYLTH
jgi:predicted RNA-binding Zn-ribbon protein involved in translation (DUF1610 family)